MNIVLIHGTWAANAEWTYADSSISQALRRAFPDSSIQRFSWSGSNSAEQRYQAASDLAEKVVTEWKSGSSDDWVLIGHSHGGNVAIAAASINAQVGADQDAEKPVSPRSSPSVRVVCLATPFLTAIESTVTLDRLSWLLSASLGYFTAFLGRALISTHVANAPEFLTPLLFLPGGLIGGWIGRSLAGIHRSYIQRMSQRINIVRSLRTAQALIVRSSADEASGALTFVRFPVWLSLYLVRRLESLMQPLYRPFGSSFEYRLPVTLCLCLLGLCFGLPAALQPDAHSNWIETCQLLFVILFNAGLLMFVAPKRIGEMIVALFLSPVLIIAALARVPFGWDLALCSIAIDITVEPVPEGSWEVYQSPLQPVLPTGRLSHSSIYDDAVAIKQSIKWVSQRDNPRPVQCIDEAESGAAACRPNTRGTGTTV
jgi:pimeloyl-ACP methyl ester carboxylesterase